VSALPRSAYSSGKAALVARLRAFPRVVFDLDGTLYDVRDFERPALAAVAAWLRTRSGTCLAGLEQALQRRREADRHRPGLFDEQLQAYGLPAAWGAECAERFHAYPASELRSCDSLRDELGLLRSCGCRLALVTNGRPTLQVRKLQMLGLEELFDERIFCDPSDPGHLKPAPWAWSCLTAWRAAERTAYVGDDPVDAHFATAGHVAFVGFIFRNPQYAN
jgi:FMN phosphatase YigB (HAD superfamily)